MKFAVLSAGAPRHGRNAAAQWQGISDSEGWGWEVSFLEWGKDGYARHDLGLYDACVWLGCFERVFEFMGGIEGPRHIAYWIGSDILQHSDLVARGYRDPFGAAATHVADAPHLAEEARALTGREVGYVRSIPPGPVAPSPIRGWESVVCYVPVGREGFFRYGWIGEVASDYPDLRFDVLRPGIAEEKVEGNLIEHPDSGREGALGLLDSCFALLRPCVHDGVSLTLVEAAQMGRHFIHSDTRVPHAVSGRSVGEIEFRLDRLLELRQQPDEAVGEFYRKEYSVEALAGDLGRLREAHGW